MKNNKNDKTPDFLVQWEGASTRASEDISLALLRHRRGQTESKLRNALASLHTDTTYIEVSDLDWAEPTTLTFTPFLIGFTSIITASGTIQYGYGQNELTRTSSVGNLLFLLPGKEIHARIAPGRQCTVTCSFDKDYAENIIGPLDQISPAQLNSALDLRSSFISGIMLRLMNEALYPGTISRAVVDSFGHSILVECANWLMKESEVAPSAGQLTAREFEIIERYLAGLSGQSPSVAALASACGLSERYFAKRFRQQTGISVSQYLKAVKISRAKALLHETELPLKEIAYQLGYSSSANFTSSFRTVTGMTPGQYRDAD